MAALESRIRELEADTSQLDTLRHTAQLFTQLQVRTSRGEGEGDLESLGTSRDAGGGSCDAEVKNGLVKRKMRLSRIQFTRGLYFDTAILTLRWWLSDT